MRETAGGDEIARAGEHRFVLGWKTGDDVGAESHVGAQPPHCGAETDRIGARVPTFHALQNEIVTVLQRQMQMRHQPRLVRERVEKIAVGLDRVDRRKPQAFELGDAAQNPLHQCAEPHFTVGVAGNVDAREDDVSLGHEATVSKVSEDQLFYLMSRGMTEDEAMAMIVRGFIEPIARELPMEYALELNRLIELQMEGAVG